MLKSRRIDTAANPDAQPAQPEMIYSLHISGEPGQVQSCHKELMTRENSRLQYVENEDGSYTYTLTKRHIPYTIDIEATIGIMAIKYPDVRAELSIQPHKPQLPGKSMVLFNGKKVWEQSGRYCRPGELDRDTLEACIEHLTSKGMFRAAETLSQDRDEMRAKYNITPHLEA